MKVWRACVVVAVLLLTGCGGSDSSKPSDRPTPGAGPKALVVSFPSGNFRSFGSPQAAAAESEYVLTGTIDGFADGRVVVSGSDPVERDRYVVIRVKVTEVMKGTARPIGEHVYLTRPRGVELTDPTGVVKPNSAVPVSVEAFATALPVGARLLVMADQMRPAAGTETPDAGSEPGSLILNVYNTQTIMADRGPASSIRGWQQIGDFDATVAHVKESLSR